MELHNLMEDEVHHTLEKVLVEFSDYCNCNKCKLDISALALNSLKPRYVVTDKGYAYSKANNFNYQSNADVLTAVTKAIEIVGKNPKHI